MTDKTKYPPKDKKVSPEDLEKTTQVDLRKLDQGFEETQIIKAPPIEEEEAILYPPKEEPVAISPKPQKETAAEKKEKAPWLQRLAESIPPEAEVPQSKWVKITEFAVGILLLFALFDASIEGLAVASPLSMLTVAATLACLLINVFFVFKRGNFHVGVEASVLALMGLITYSTWKYGSVDSEVFTLFKHSPAELFNFIFLLIYLTVLGIILSRSRISLGFRVLLSFLIVYGSLGLFENLFRGVSSLRVWNLEDTLLGSELWKWVPKYYLRPTLFSLWGVLPFLALFFLFFKKSPNAEPQGGFFRRNIFVFSLLILSLVLGHVVLLNHHLPNFFSFLTRSSLGVGETRAFTPQSGEGGYEIEITTSNLSTEKNNDLAAQYRMAAIFTPSKEGKKNISLVVRNFGGQIVPFLKANDLTLLQEQVAQKPIRIHFREDEVLKQKTVAVLIDRSSSMVSAIPFIQRGVKDLFGITNSKENFLLASFSDQARAQWIKNSAELQKQLISLSAQGGSNLSNALEITLKTLESAKGDQAILLIAPSEASLSEDLQAKISTRFKSSHIKLYLLSLGNLSPSSPLKSLAEGSGGKVLVVFDVQNLSSALLGSFADAFGEYQISYEGQSFAPKLKITFPGENSEVYQETALNLKILNAPDVRVKTARLYIDSKPIQELPVQGLSEVVFTLNPKQLPRGPRLFKASVITEDGKEYSEQIKLNLTEENEFRFIRPLNGDAVSGQMNLEVYFKSHSQNSLVSVDFLVDGQKVSQVSSEPYLYTWDTSSLSGEHLVQAVANFGDGSTQTEQVKVNVVAGFSVKLLSPSVGEFLSNLTDMEADVSHGLSEIVSKVEFLADGELLGEVTQAPYKYLWDNADLPIGRHVLQVRAYSTSNLVSSDAVVVNIGTGTLSILLAGVTPGPEALGAPSYLSPDSIEWVLDASSSMNGPLEGIRKIDLVRQAMSQILSKIPSSTQVAYRWFGSESSATHHDCKDSTVAYPLQPVNSGKINSVLNQVEAKGLTPLGFAFDKLRSDLKKASGSRVVVLLTDGFENCGGDPVGQLERWKKEKLNTKLYVVGLDLDGTRDEIELKRLASMMGGQYYPVHNQKELLFALDEMVKVTYRVLDYKDREITQRPIGSPSLALRTGEYRVEVDLEPPLVKEKVLVNNGVEKKLVLKKVGNTFSLEE
jgi:Mg-chelatase subunit ChlD